MKKFDSSGAPAEYDVIEKYIANDLWALGNNESGEHLKGKAKERYFFLKNRKDSFDHVNALEDRPGDSIHMESGTIVYTQPGLKRPVEYYRIGNEMGSMKVQIKRRTKRIIRFSRPNKWYRWCLPGKDGDKNNTVKFFPGHWYKTTLHCNYGMLTDGYCTFYFSFDKNGKISIKKKDRINDGPF